VYTDDAATKLIGGVHRCCFNCRMTNTTVWRRSPLTPGKSVRILCGLFERTHMHACP
ncbi:hypothetical protein B0H17DRAFT_890632, partial [Mycena rosella]